MPPCIILPGIGNSGPDHWQSHWQQRNPSLTRFQPSDWDHPDRDDWLAALDKAVATTPEPPFLIAHSLSCLLIARWLERPHAPIRGAFLVRVPDPSSPAFPRTEAPTFLDIPNHSFQIPALIVASTNDPYGSTDYAQTRARQWGTGLVTAGPLGHIGDSSGVGDWPQGRALFTAFTAGTGTAVDL